MKAATCLCPPPRRVSLISIHAAREGGDACGYNRECNPVISIHAAREGGDRPAAWWSSVTGHISIHAAREGGDAARMPKVRNDEISIHAAREGGDLWACLPRLR